MYRQAMIAGSIFATLAVILGAFGAHALKEVLSETQLQTFETGVRYQVYHSFALLAAGIAYGHMPAKQLKLASLFFIIGIVLFSGSLYLLTIMKVSGQVGLGGFGLITPVGGLFFIAGWIMLCIGFIQKK